MIAIFTVLGLLLFGGGVYAIYDGWPYLVLERGFTEVILGAIASSAGLIMLSLAWVLKEVRATRRELLEAIELRAQSSLPAVAAEEGPFVTPMRSEAPSSSRSVAPAAIGVAAGAAAGAIAHALAGSDDDKTAASAEASAPSGDRDLFGALVARELEEPEPDAEGKAELSMAEGAEPLPDMFEEALTPPAPDEHSGAFEAERHEPAGPVAAKAAPPAEEVILAGHDEPGSFDDRSSDDAPATPVADLDEFGALRASLAGHLNEPEREVGRIEPSFSTEPDPFAAAESWMDRAAPRHEPWLDTPSAEEPASVDEAAPLWPPRTAAQDFDTPAEPEAVGRETETPVDPIGALAHAEPESASAEALPEAAIIGEPQAQEPVAAADNRPASDEGIVGAYQVGDAHFTIFADGSIRARTRDGEYSFASMDELKVYLASEKSRLGV